MRTRLRRFLKLPVIHYYWSRPRFSSCCLVTILVPFLMPSDWLPSTRFLVGWDIGTGAYLVLAAVMMAHSGEKKIRSRAKEQNEGKVPTLMLIITAAVASLAAIVNQLASVKSLTEAGAGWHVGLAGMTVFLSWTFMQVMFALHYAHEYYIDHDGAPAGGVEFPGEKHPDYWDFVYFSLVIGASAQTSDVSITARAFRHVVSLHSIISFFFNAIILALTISIGARFFE
jgi:uncharacterized membrane protein